jgi:acetyl-CoA acetyltransferase
VRVLMVLCSPVRTAIGAFNGSLKAIPATDLGAAVVRETLRRSGLQAAAIGSVVMGNFIQADNKMNPPRQASIGWWRTGRATDGQRRGGRWATGAAFLTIHPSASGPI